MSNRETLLALLAKNPLTCEELVDATGWPKKKVQDTIHDMRTGKLMDKPTLDDMTGKPLYSLNAEGKSRAAKIPAPKIAKTAPAAPEIEDAEDVVSQSSVVEDAPAETEPHIINGTAIGPYIAPLPEAVKIAQEIIDSDQLGIHAGKRIDVAALINRVSELERGAFKLEAENDELRNEAGHCVSKIEKLAEEMRWSENLVANLRGQVDKLFAERNALQAKIDGLEKSSGSAPAGQKYVALTNLPKMHDSIDEATKFIADRFGRDEGDFFILTCSVAGKLEHRAVFIPIAEAA